MDQHPECTPGSVDIDKVVKKEIPGNRSTAEERLDEEGARDTADKKDFKDTTETETKQGESRDCSRNSRLGAKQTEISFSEIKHPERQTIGSLESSHIEIVPKTEIRVGEPKEVVPLESSLPPLEDPSVILLSPSSTRRSDTAMANETEDEKNEKPEGRHENETVKQEETQENKSESLDIKQLTSLQKQMAKNKQKTSTTNSSLSSKHDDYADLVEEVKHIKEDKAR